MNPSYEQQAEAAALYLLSDGRKRIGEAMRKMPPPGNLTVMQRVEVSMLQRRYEKTKRRCLRYADAFRECRDRIEGLSTARHRIG